MKKVLLKRSASLVQGQPVLPTTSEIEYGELAVNYASGHETISMKNSNNQVVSFSSDEKFLDKVGLGHDEENDELYVRGLGGFTGDNYTTATSLQEVISDNEFVTAAALNELNNNKLDASAATGFMTSAQVETQITGKNYVTSAQVETQITGKNYATVSQIPNVGDYFDGAEYDSENVRINFKHGDTVKAYIDAAVFIKDGMVSDVEIATPTAGTHSGVECLVVTFNTDAEKSVIEIPLSDIFDSSNYYNKTEVDSEIERLEGMIEDDEYVISTAINDLRDSKLDSSAATDFATTGQVETQITGKNYVTSGQVETQITGKNYVTSAQVETQITGKNYATVSQLPEDILIARYGQPMTQEMLDSFLVPFGDEDTNKPVLLKTEEGNVATYMGSIAGLGYTFCQAEASSENQAKIYYYYYNEGNQRWGSSSITLSVSGHTHSNYMTSAQVESQITGKGYITGYTETDPTVPSWAKAASKPTYTASEVGAMASGTTLDGIADGATRKLSNYSLTSHTHSNYVTSGQVETQITGKNYVTSGQVETQVAGRVLPTVTAADNGKVLQVVNGAWALVTPSTVYTGENTPPSSIGNDGDIYLQTD